MKKGSLHRKLHIPQDEGIPTNRLDQIIDANEGTHIRSRGYSVPVTKSLKKQAQFARSFR